MTITHLTTGLGVCPNCGSWEQVYRPPGDTRGVLACNGCGARWVGVREGGGKR